MRAQCLGMMTVTELLSVPSDHLVPFTDPLRPAVAAYLARFKGSSRYHTESDLRCYLAWCAERGLDPLAARRPHLELYIRWMQEIRRFTVSRRFSVTAGSTGPASSTACWTTHPPRTAADHARADGEGQAVDGGLVAVAFQQAVDFYHHQLRWSLRAVGRYVMEGDGRGASASQVDFPPRAYGLPLTRPAGLRGCA